jgi:hypothetical protein
MIATTFDDEFGYCLNPRCSTKHTKGAEGLHLFIPIKAAKKGAARM